MKLNQIDDKAGAKFFKDLELNNTLLHLDLEANMLGTMTARKLTAYLQTGHGSLTHILLGNNNFSSEDIDLLCEALPSNKQLFRKSQEIK